MELVISDSASSPRLSSTPPLTFNESFGIPRLDTPDFDPVPLSHTVSGILGKYMEEGGITSSSFDLSYDHELVNIKDIVFDWDVDSEDEKGQATAAVNGSKDKDLPRLPSDSFFSPEPEYSPCLSDFVILPNQALLSGNAGRLCIERSTGRIYAIRKLMQARQVWPELAILETLKATRAPFSPMLHCFFGENSHVYLVTEHYCGGTLAEIIGRNGTFNSDQVFFYACEIITGLNSLHRLGIVHRNISPDTILFDAYNHVILSGMEHASITDSRRICRQNMCTIWQNSYRAPELLLGWDHDARVDSWSFGLVMYFMLRGDHLLLSVDANDEGNKSVESNAIYNRVPSEALRFVNATAQNMITNCLERNPAMRYTSLEIRNHSYFSKADWEKITNKEIEVPKLRDALISFHDCSNAGTDHMLFDSCNDFTEEKTPRSQITFSKSFLGRLLTLLSKSLPITEASGNRNIIHGLDMSKNSSLADASGRSSVVGQKTSDSPESILPALGNVACSQSHEVQNKAMTFWDALDHEEHNPSLFCDCSGLTSVTKPFSQAWKLRKKHSLSYLRCLLKFNTTSIWHQLRRREKSIAALKHEGYAEPIPDLPKGLYQLGSGIGYAHRIVPSRISVPAPVPRAYQGLLQSWRIPVLASGSKTRGSTVPNIVKEPPVGENNALDVSVVIITSQDIEQRQTGDDFNDAVASSSPRIEPVPFSRGLHSPSEAINSDKDAMISFLAEDIQDWESIEKIYATEYELNPESTVRLVTPRAGMRFSLRPSSLCNV